MSVPNWIEQNWSGLKVNIPSKIRKQLILRTRRPQLEFCHDILRKRIWEASLMEAKAPRYDSNHPANTFQCVSNHYSKFVCGSDSCRDEKTPLCHPETKSCRWISRIKFPSQNGTCSPTTTPWFHATYFPRNEETKGKISRRESGEKGPFNVPFHFRLRRGNIAEKNGLQLGVSP